MSIGYLASFAYFAKMNMATFKARLGADANLFADSGAFSALSVGTVITCEDYARWLWRYHNEFDVYVNLDVIGSEKESAANLQTLESYGLKPLPVFHYGAKIDSIKKAVDEGHTYMALGGLASIKDAEGKLRWIDEAFNAVPKTVGFHGFGFTRFKYMLHWPWESVDSSSWLSGARYNNCTLFDNGDFITFNLGDKSKRIKYAQIIADHGGDAEKFVTGKWHYRETFQLGAVAAYRSSEFWCARAKAQGGKEPRLYLSSSPAPLIVAAKSIRDYKKANRKVENVAANNH